MEIAMARTAKATPEAVYTAIDAIRARGENITLDAVRRELGGGSLATIQPLVQQWRAEQDQHARDAAQTQPNPDPGADMPIPMRVAQALDQANQAIAGIGAAVVDAINGAVADERRRARIELDAEREAADRRVRDAEERAAQTLAEAAQVAQDGQQLEAERDSLAEDLEQLRTAHAALTAQAHQQSKDLVKTTAERDRLATERDQLSRRVGELERDRAAQDERAAQEQQAHHADLERVEAQGRADAERLRTELTELRAVLAQERDEFRAELERAKADAQGQIDALRSERADLRAALTQEREERREEQRNATRRLDELHGELTTATAAQARAEAQRDAAKERAAELHALLGDRQDAKADAGTRRASRKAQGGAS